MKTEVRSRIQRFWLCSIFNPNISVHWFQECGFNIQQVAQLIADKYNGTYEITPNFYGLVLCIKKDKKLAEFYILTDYEYYNRSHQ